MFFFYNHHQHNKTIQIQQIIFINLHNLPQNHIKNLDILHNLTTIQIDTKHTQFLPLYISNHQPNFISPNHQQKPSLPHNHNLPPYILHFTKLHKKIPHNRLTITIQSPILIPIKFHNKYVTPIHHHPDHHHSNILHHIYSLTKTIVHIWYPINNNQMLLPPQITIKSQKRVTLLP